MPSKKESAFKYTFRTCNWLYILKKWISFSYLRLRHSFLIWEIQIIENMNESLCTWSFWDKSECYKSNSGSYQTASSVMTTYQLISLPSKSDSLAVFHSFVHMDFQYLGFICNFFPLTFFTPILLINDFTCNHKGQFLYHHYNKDYGQQTYQKGPSMT